MNKITNHMPTAELQALDAAHHMHPFTANTALGKKRCADHDAGQRGLADRQRRPQDH